MQHDIITKNFFLQIKKEPKHYSGVMGYNCPKALVMLSSILLYTKVIMLSIIIKKKRYKYKTHRVLIPDGTLFEFDINRKAIATRIGRSIFLSTVAYHSLLLLLILYPKMVEMSRTFAKI